MSIKTITYSLLSVIVLLTALLAYSFYTTTKNKELEDTRVKNIITVFETKFKQDSIALVNYNTALIDEITQRLTDSILQVYETKLIIAYQNNYLSLNNKLIHKNANADANQENIDIALNNTYQNNLGNFSNKSESRSSNATTYSKLNNNNSNSYNNTSNVTTYSKLNNNNSNSYSNTSNVTTYSKLNNNNSDSYKSTSNVTTYSKLNNNNSDSYKKPANVTTYSKLNKNTTNSVSNNKIAKVSTYSNRKDVINNNKLPVLQSKYSNSNSVNNKGIYYSNNILNTAININDIQIAPIFPGCENSTNENNKKNCLANKMSNYVIENFNSSNFSKKIAKKGLNNIRVLFIIDNYGYSKTAKIVGNWDPKVRQEVKRVINSIPKMIPGKSNNGNVTVKYSFKIPFIVK